MAKQSDALLAADGERKSVTALFADIKGSMELMEDLDPEDARAIVDPALKLMIEAAEHYGKYVAQSTGDGIFAPFGAPIVHEDHPRRALYAAIRIQEKIQSYGDKLRGESHLRVHRDGSRPHNRTDAPQQSRDIFPAQVFSQQKPQARCERGLSYVPRR